MAQNSDGALQPQSKVAIDNNYKKKFILQSSDFVLPNQ